MNCSTPGFPVHHQHPELPKPMSIESVMPFSHLILCHPLLLLPTTVSSPRHACSVTQSCSTFCNPMVYKPWAPLFMGFSIQQYWSRLPFSPPSDLSDPGIELMSITSPALSRGFFITEPLGKPPSPNTYVQICHNAVENNLRPILL